MSDTHEFEVLRANVPTRGGNIYPEHVIKQIAEQINSRGSPLPGQLGNTGPTGRVNLRDLSHKVLPTARVVDGKLMVDVQIEDTPSGRVLADWLSTSGTKEKTKAAPIGLGSLGPDRVVGTDYRLTTITFFVDDK